MKSKSGFTIVELIIVITIISLLTTIAIVSYTKVQSNARDTTRQQNVTSIDEALEKYYVNNGEYPSVRSIVNNFAGNTGAAVASKLNVDITALAMPQMPSGATNALTSTTPIANDYILYTASST